jgi:hypothetical protein
MKRRTLFPTGEKPARRPVPKTPAAVLIPPAALTRAVVAATLADALGGLPPEKRGPILAKAIALLRPWEQGAVTRFVIDLLREDAGRGVAHS